jgi:hypothetical protein
VDVLVGGGDIGSVVFGVPKIKGWVVKTPPRRPAVGVRLGEDTFKAAVTAVPDKGFPKINYYTLFIEGFSV